MRRTPDLPAAGTGRAARAHSAKRSATFTVVEEAGCCANGASWSGMQAIEHLRSGAVPGRQPRRGPDRDARRRVKAATRWTTVLVIAALLVVVSGTIGCGGEGAREAAAGTAAEPPIARVDAAHPPVVWGGPDGRSALDGVWIERGDPAAAGTGQGWSKGAFSG